MFQTNVPGSVLCRMLSIVFLFWSIKIFGALGIYKLSKLLLKIAFLALYSLLIEIDCTRWCWFGGIGGTLSLWGLCHSVAHIVWSLWGLWGDWCQFWPLNLNWCLEPWQACLSFYFSILRQNSSFFLWKAQLFVQYVPHKVIPGATGRIPPIHKFTFFCASLPIFMG